MSSENSTLRISIDGKWSVSDFNTIMKSIDELYAFNNTMIFSDKSENLKNHPDQKLKLIHSVTNMLLELNSRYRGVLADTSVPGFYTEFIRDLSREINDDLFSKNSSEREELILKFLSVFNRYQNETSSLFNKFENDINQHMNRLSNNIYETNSEFQVRLINLISSYSSPKTNEGQGFINVNNSLFVKEIKYASPGFTDVAGLAESIKQLKDFFVYLFERYDRKPFRQLEIEKETISNEIQKQSLLRNRIDNARAYAEFMLEMKDRNVSDLQLDQLTSFIENKEDSLKELIISKKIVDVQIIKEDEFKN